MKQKIYFNPIVSLYFNCRFYNSGDTKTVSCSAVLSCPLRSWDIDTKRNLESMGDKEITITGIGTGWWEYEVEPHQNNPNELKKESYKDYDKFMKGGGLLFI